MPTYIQHRCHVQAHTGHLWVSYFCVCTYAYSHMNTCLHTYNKGLMSRPKWHTCWFGASQAYHTAMTFTDACAYTYSRSHLNTCLHIHYRCHVQAHEAQWWGYTSHVYYTAVTFTHTQMHERHSHMNTCLHIHYRCHVQAHVAHL